MMRDLEEVLLGLLCSVGGIVMALFLGFSFLSSIASALRKVSPANRLMEPDQVWLNVIPVFNLVWAPITVDRVAESLRNEYYSRGLHRRGRGYGRGSGLSFLLVQPILLLFLFGSAESRGFYFPTILLLGVAFALWIAYWSGLSAAVRGLKAEPYRPPPVDEGW